MVIVCLVSMLTSFKDSFIHSICVQQSVAAIYLASSVERDIDDFFFVEPIYQAISHKKFISTGAFTVIHASSPINIGISFHCNICAFGILKTKVKSSFQVYENSFHN